MIETILAAAGLGLSAAFFDPEPFRAAGSSEMLRSVTLAMLFLAGISRALGTSAILALNHVPGRRYLAAFLTEGVVFVGAALVYAACAVLADWAFFGDRIPNERLFWIVAVAHSPMLFGVLILMPYLGEAIDRALRIWMAVLVFFALHRGLGMPFHAALGVALTGWLTYSVFSIAFGRPLQVLTRALRRLASGPTA